MNALVVNTAAKTFFGKTAKLVEQAQTPSHFQKAISKIGDYLIFLAIGLVIMIVLVSIFRGQNILDIIQFALILTVAGIPAALPAVSLSYYGHRRYSPRQERKQSLANWLQLRKWQAWMCCAQTKLALLPKMSSPWEEPNLMINSQKMMFYCSVRSLQRRR